MASKSHGRWKSAWNEINENVVLRTRHLCDSEFVFETLWLDCVIQQQLIPAKRYTLYGNMHSRVMSAKTYFYHDEEREHKLEGATSNSTIVPTSESAVSAANLQQI